MANYKLQQNHRCDQRLSQRRNPNDLINKIAGNLHIQQTQPQRKSGKGQKSLSVTAICRKTKPDQSIKKYIYPIILNTMTYEQIHSKSAATSKAKRNSPRNAVRNLVQMLAKAVKKKREKVEDKTITKRINVHVMKFGDKLHTQRREGTTQYKKCMR